MYRRIRRVARGLRLAGVVRRVVLASGHMRWAFATVRETCPRLFVVFAVIAAVVAIVPAGIALSLRGLVNSANDALGGQPLGDTDAYFWLVVGFIMTFIGSAGAVISRYIVQRLEVELGTRINLDILRHHAAMPFVRLEQRDYRDSLRRAQTAPEVHVSKVYALSIDMATKALQIASLLLILFAIEPLLFVLLIPVGIPFLLFRWRLSRRQFEEMDKRVEKRRWMDYFRSVLGNTDQAAETRLLGVTEEFVGRWNHHAQEFRRLRLDYQRFEFVGSIVFALFSVAVVYVAFGHAIGGIVDRRLTVGDLAIFGSAAAQLRSLVESSVVIVANMRWEVLGVERVREYFAIEAGGGLRHDLTPKESVGRVEFRDVTFRYPGAVQPILDRLSFAIEPGETVALVGENGAGKSTVAKLIAGLYWPDAGRVLIDGIDTGQMDPTVLRRQVACLFQNYGRYAATVADNIAFGDWERLKDDRSRIESIVERAGIASFIDKLPNGLDTTLGREFGTHQISGGQWQQLATARLIARDARVLVLDEPTANLDVKIEAEYFRMFRRMAMDRSLLIISHRFSTVTSADRILVIDRGRVVESGSHRELIDRDGLYAMLFGRAGISETDRQ